MLDLTIYTPDHRVELERLLKGPQWQEAINSGLVDQVMSERIDPGVTKNFIDTVVDQLLDFNENRVRDLVAGGHDDQTALLCELSRWPEGLEGKNPLISFLGFSITMQCNFVPRCVYCNQEWVDASVDLGGWKDVIEEVTASNKREGPYIYITGGEPLILKDDLWGDDGLIRFASERGAAVNVNTNAIMLTPEVALRFIKTGLSKLHISIDTADMDTQNYLFSGERLNQVLEGIYNVQLARDILGVSYPEIHTNCVLTNKNLDTFPALFSFILEKRKQHLNKNAPLYNDLFPHVIPVGGSSNDGLRPTEEGFKRFYEEIWPEVCRLWDAHQEELDIPREERGVLFGYFSNPFLRVEHEGGLEAYAKAAAEGLYGKMALPQHCYVAPTQATFTPDGVQYRCGSHAIRRISPTGNITATGVFDNIRAGIAGLDDFPQEDSCYGCALATLYINQAVESRLKEKIDSMTHPAEES